MESATAVAAPAVPSWTDPKRYAWLLGLIVPLLPFIAWGLVELTGLGAFYWFGPVIVFGIFPVLDQLIGTDSDNPPDSVLTWLEADVLPLVHVPVPPPAVRLDRVRLLAVGVRRPQSSSSRSASPSAVGTVSGIAINTAHELGHKRESSERWLSKIALAQTFYGHFFIEHNRGHHVRVSTPEDPASSRFGESFYEFWPRTVWGSLTSAIEIEKHAPRTASARLLVAQERPAQRLADDGRALRRADRCLRLGRAAVPDPPGGHGLLAARGRQLPRALRPAAQKKDDGRYERCQPEHTAGTATRSRRTSSCTTCSATATTTPTRPAATRRCATSTRRRTCRAATRR